MEKIPAPIDNKNILEDAFDDVFMDFCTAKDHYKNGVRHFVGMHETWGSELGGAIVDVKWHFGDACITITMLAAAGQEDFSTVRDEVFACAKDTFKEWECEENPGLLVEFEQAGDTLEVSFYFECD